MPKLKNKILKTELVSWQELKDLQPTNLKNPYHNQKTKDSLIKNGFSFAFYVWQSEDGIFLLDGHLRTDLLRELINDGFEVPEKLTCTFLDLKNRKEAVKYLLEVFNTKTNPIDQSAMVSWLEVEEIKIGEVSVESLGVEIVNQIEDSSDKNKEVNLDDLGNESNLVFKFNHQSYLNVLDLLNNAKEKLGCDTNEDTLLKLLNDYE